MGEGRRRCYNDFLLRMSSFLLFCVCVVENLFKVFLSEMALPTFVGIENIYSMGEG